jgi:hypothetical protein
VPPGGGAAEIEPVDADAEREQAEARFRARRERLLRCGWSPDEADALADRLRSRDADQDDRRSCAADCLHYRLGRCGNWRRAGFFAPELGRDLAGTLQRCPGFEALAVSA